MSDALFLPAGDLAAAFRAGALCPVAHVEACLARIAALDPALDSFVAVADDAVAQAEASRARLRDGRPAGPLDGVPVAIKDNYTTADLPTRAGAADRAFPRRDAAAVARLRAAGAVILGKTRMHAFAWGTVTPPTRNPWDTGRVPGGSSGGSAAALAAGLCAASLGSDTGGSIRIPASLCGTVGLKATFGAVSRAGVVPHSWSLDHAGPLTRTAADAALLHDVLAGPDPDDPATAGTAARPVAAALDGGVAGLTLAVCRNHFFERLQPEVEAAVEAAIAALAGLGARIVEVEVPRLAYGLGAIFAIELASSTAWHDRALQAGATAGYPPDVRDLVEMGRLVSAPDYLKAEQLRTALIADFRAVLAEADAVLGPTEPLTAWSVGQWTTTLGGAEESVLAASWRLTYPYNLTGLPAVSVPCGFDGDGLPIGLQIAGRPFDEATVLRVAAAYERAHDWHERRPPSAPGGAP